MSTVKVQNVVNTIRAAGALNESSIDVLHDAIGRNMDPGERELVRSLIKDVDSGSIKATTKQADSLRFTSLRDSRWSNYRSAISGLAKWPFEVLENQPLALNIVYTILFGAPLGLAMGLVGAAHGAADLFKD
jgi:hypothetical protein